MASSAKNVATVTAVGLKKDGGKVVPNLLDDMQHAACEFRGNHDRLPLIIHCRTCDEVFDATGFRWMDHETKYMHDTTTLGYGCMKCGFKLKKPYKKWWQSDIMVPTAVYGQTRNELEFSVEKSDRESPEQGD